MSEVSTMRRMPPAADLAAAMIIRPADTEWFDAIPGERLAIRVSGNEVGGRFSIFESVAQPGTTTPQHFHREDELFHVLEGTLRFLLDGKTVDAPAGTTVVVPAGAHHAWRNRSDRPVRMLVIFTPGGVEALFRQVAGLAPAEIAALAASFGTQVVGPPIID